MADYYPLIARAVAGLEKNTGDARRALYERARTALVAQLRGVTPSLSESDVTRERLALEEAVRKVEAESARHTWVEPSARAEVRPEPPSNKVRPPEMPRWEEPLAPSGQEPPPPPSPPPRRASSPPPPRPDAMARRQSPPATPPSARQVNGPAPSGIFGDERYVDPVFDQPMSNAAAAAAPAAPQRHPLRGRPSGERRSLLDSGLNDFRNVVSETDELGEASAHSAKSAREGYAEPMPSGRDFDRHPAPGAFDSHDTDEMLQDVPAPEMLEPSFGMDEARPLPNRARPPRHARDDDEVESAPRRSYRDLIRVGVALLIVAGIGGTLAWQWPNMAALYRSLRAPSTEVASEQTPTTASRTKIIDRFEPGGAQQQQNAAVTPPATGAAVAQRVVLYEEDPNDPQGKRFVGSAIWRTETISPGPGLPPELAIRADVEIPERRIAMTWSLRRNSDPGLPASHTVEIMFKLPTDFASGGVSNVPGILMKQAEQSRGVPLAGLAVKVTNGFFLIGLSSVDADKERNVSLLKERSWFDIPVVYNNNRRAILALEKGTPGERAFAEAFSAWRQ